MGLIEWVANAWLASAAVMLELVHRAPTIDKDDEL
jgi:hypothetical protein